MEYPIEIIPASKNGWHTPDEARSYYGRYSRVGVTIHWWDNPNNVSDSDHDNIVNYILRQAQAGVKSVNYVLSNNKISLLVGPDNVAWASQSGNPTTISIECSPHLNDEGYKKLGWLIQQLEERYNNRLQIYPHNYWFSTSCPGTISLDKIAQEVQKFRDDFYDLPPPLKKAKLTWSTFPTALVYVTNKETTLWNFDQVKWSGFGDGIKKYPKGEKITIYGQCLNETIGATYLLTEYSYTKKITNGFNSWDLDLYVEPTAPNPVPDPMPDPEVPFKNEWEKNLRDIDDTKYWVKSSTKLVDITTGIELDKEFKKGEEFIASALTIANETEYRITEYSFKKGIFNGIPISKLTLTPPGEPNIPPVPDNPDLVNKNVVIVFLESLVELITNFIKKLKG